MKYYIIAGERSGDLHGSHLIRELSKIDAQPQFRAWGGDLMQAEGAELVVHYKNLAFMGIWEVFTNLLTIKRYMDQCKQDLLNYQPDVAILIDYPGFNLKIAEFAHSIKIPVCYYISPKLWAWNRKRAKKIKSNVDRMYSILPFEKEFYQNYNYQIEFVGNPLVEQVGNFNSSMDIRSSSSMDIRSRLQLDHRPIVAVLPGSRRQEINHMLGHMITLKSALPHYHFVVAGVDNVPRDYYTQAAEDPDIHLVFDQTYPLLKESHAAVVASGTASLETALFEVPQVVCYKTSWLTYWVGRMLIKVKYISLVNLILDRELVPEHIQGDFTTEKLAETLKTLLTSEDSRKKQLAGYRQIKMLLGNKNASRETASLIFDFLATAG